MHPTTKIINRVAARKEIDELELPPLFDALDPDALDKLVKSADVTDTRLQIEFDYAGYRVTVSGNGDVELQQRETVPN